MRFGWEEYFYRPELVWFLCLLPLAWLLLREADRSRGRALDRLFGVDPKARGNRDARALQSRLSPNFSPRRRRLRRWIFLAGLGASVLAAMQPLWGRGGETLEPKGVDLVVCLDVSRSMLARDELPDRLERARELGRELAGLVLENGGRVGLVAFAGEARLISPLTRDAEALDQLFDEAELLTELPGGTDLAAALDLAGRSLEASEGDHDAVLLLSDGDDPQGRARRSAAALNKAKAVVHCVGFGSARGAKIPVLDAEGKEVYLRDVEGKEVLSRLDPEGLKQTAQAGGGAYFDPRGSAIPLVKKLDATLRERASRAFEKEERRRRKNRYQWPLLAALLLFVLELSRTDGRRS